MQTFVTPRRSRPRREKEVDTAAILGVLRCVARVCDVRLQDFIARDRSMKVAHARHLAIGTLHSRFPGLVHEQIAEIFRRHVTSVGSSIMVHGSLLKCDATYQKRHSLVLSQLDSL